MLDFSQNLTRSELADAMGINRVTLWRMERAGRIPSGTRVHPTRTEYTPAQQMAIASMLDQPVGC